MHPPYRFWPSIILILTLSLACPTFSGCNIIKPAPIAAGQDSVIVNAQRIQTSSLDVYIQVTEWELENRATLPAGVSRAVDKYRAEFKPAWEASRQALKDYKAKRGPSLDTLSRLNAALSVAQSALLSLQLGNSGNEISQANSAIFQLTTSIRTLLKKPTP